jgi:hypothetical protein
VLEKTGLAEVQARQEARRAYDAIRRSTDDVAQIAKATGRSEAEIAQIKSHIFVDEHELTAGLRRFDPDAKIADAWTRLQAGTHTAQDLAILQHEADELMLVKAGLSQNAAHSIATSVARGEGTSAVAAVGETNPSAGLMPGEGLFGTYDDLIDLGTKGDHVTPHHMPSARHMDQHGVPRGQGLSLNMEHPVPGAGGRHRRTFTYGTNADAGMQPRQALARGIWDARRIYMEDGLYGTYIRQQFRDFIQRYKALHPGLFGKG